MTDDELDPAPVKMKRRTKNRQEKRLKKNPAQAWFPQLTKEIKTDDL